MAYTQMVSFDASDRINTDCDETRLPYLIAVPIWLVLAALAWSPVLLLIRAITA
ncbi:MAG: hypothetical protein ISR50_14550 [Alphaproteobacteria bacterium]|nr:hypothetical protein [Alphaproteobacteria bacterium]